AMLRALTIESNSVFTVLTTLSELMISGFGVWRLFSDYEDERRRLCPTGWPIPESAACNRSAAWHASKSGTRRSPPYTDITDARADTLSRTARMPKALDSGRFARRRLELTHTECLRFRELRIHSACARTPTSPAVPRRCDRCRTKIIKKLRQGIINIRHENYLSEKRFADYQLAGGSERDVWLIGRLSLGLRARQRVSAGQRRTSGQAVLEPAPHPLPAVRRRHGRSHVRRRDRLPGPASREDKVAEQMVRRRSRADGSDLRSVTPCVHLIIEGRPQGRASGVGEASRPARGRGCQGAPAELPKRHRLHLRENTELESQVRDRGHNGEHFSSGIRARLQRDRSPPGLDWLMKLGEPAYQRMLNATSYESESMTQRASWTDWLMTESKTVGYHAQREPDGLPGSLLRAVGLYVSAKSGGGAAQPATTIASALVSAMMLRNMKSLARVRRLPRGQRPARRRCRQFRRPGCGSSGHMLRAGQAEETLDTLVRRLPVWDGQTLLTLADQG
uniref:ANK_REP_REGION domain-containing protein n=1 Tax=Macrostomum lignano TaxID=282301 RepID=A0A1I8FKD3_9PLAT